MDVLARPGAGTAPDVLLIGAGPMALDVPGDRRPAGRPGHRASPCVDPRWVKPLDGAIARRPRQAPAGGHGRGQRAGRRVRRRGLPGCCARPACHTPVQTFGLPQRFLDHASREQILDEVGLTPQHLARQITEAVAQLDPELADNPQG